MPEANSHRTLIVLAASIDMVGRGRGRGGGGRGGAGRGQGRKSSSATPAARPAAPDATSTKKQMTLATLLGPRHEASALTARRPAVLATDVIKWRSGEDGEKAEKQVKGGPVKYAMDLQKAYDLVQAGSDENQTVYWVDREDNEHPAGDSRAVTKRTRGGKGFLQIKEVGESSELWVSQAHVEAGNFGKRQQGFTDLLGRRDATVCGSSTLTLTLTLTQTPLYCPWRCPRTASLDGTYPHLYYLPTPSPPSTISHPRTLTLL